MPDKPWRNRRWLRGAFSEIGCGFLTILLVTIPLWVVSIASRGPVFAVGLLALLLLVVVGVAVIKRFLQRR